MTRRVLDLSFLTPEQGFVIPGIAEFDRLGVAVSGAGDINNDGIDDIIVGAPAASDAATGGISFGEAYVIYGEDGFTRETVDPSNLPIEDGFVMRGPADNDLVGNNVANAGDINGDGIDDFLVGAPGDDRNGPPTGFLSTGALYVIYGTNDATRSSPTLPDLPANEGFVLLGVNDEEVGLIISSAGDVNADGIDDILIGSPRTGESNVRPGKAFIVYGTEGTSRGTIDLSNLQPEDGFFVEGFEGALRVGRSVSAAGDLNGDGIDDFIIGARRNSNDPTSIDNAYVIYGTNGATRESFSLADFDANDGFAIETQVVGLTVGHSVSRAGDINGDGIDDVVLSSLGVNGGAGAAYVIYGTNNATRDTVRLNDLPASDGFVILGDEEGDSAGGSVSNAGDVNGDGIDDIVIGARSGDDGGFRAGEAYVIYGSDSPTRDTVDLTNLGASDGFVIQGDDEGDGLGGSVSGAGDVNGDGIDDIIIGAERADPNGNSSGEAYVIYGFRTEAATLANGVTGGPLTGGEFADTLSTTAGSNVIRGLDGDDVLAGGFDADVIFGGTGNDILLGDTTTQIAGADRLDGGADDDLLQGGGGADTFVFTTNDGNDTIGTIALDYADLTNSTVSGADFVSGIDKIELSGFGLADGAAAIARVTDVGGVATFSDQGTVITFAGLTTADLSADDFQIV